MGSKKQTIDELTSRITRLEKTVGTLEKRLEKQKHETKRIRELAKKAAKQAVGEAEKQVRKVERRLRRSTQATADTLLTVVSDPTTESRFDPDRADDVGLERDAAGTGLVTESGPETVAAPTVSGTKVDPTWNVTRLRRVARERGVKNYSRKTKDQLLVELQ